jgi:hypothetical protein
MTRERLAFVLRGRRVLEVVRERGVFDDHASWPQGFNKHFDRFLPESVCNIYIYTYIHTYIHTVYIYNNKTTVSGLRFRV